MSAICADKGIIYVINLWHCLGWSLSGRTGEHKHRAFPSQLQSQLAATSSLEENMLPLL